MKNNIEMQSFSIQMLLISNFIPRLKGKYIDPHSYCLSLLCPTLTLPVVNVDQLLISLGNSRRLDKPKGRLLDSNGLGTGFCICLCYNSGRGQG